MARSGAPWRDLPQRFVKWDTTYRRFRRWAQGGIWKQVFDALQESDLDWPGHRCGDDPLNHRARASAGCRTKKSSADQQALGRLRGGLTTKIHALVDALGDSVCLELSPGQAGDAPYAVVLLADCKAFGVTADKAHDVDWLLEGLARNGSDAVIPSSVKRVEARVIDKNLYADRNKVEPVRRCGYFNKLKQYRPVATRYEKTADSFLAMIYLASSMILLL